MTSGSPGLKISSSESGERVARLCSWLSGVDVAVGAHKTSISYANMSGICIK
jgi:hypothetical protein